MSFPSFKRRFNSIYILVWIQSLFRLLLRATWLGAAGVILGWGLNDLWGWVPDARFWLALGGIFMAISLLGMKIPHRRAQFAWGLDRGIGLKEQISTAWQATQAGQTGEITEFLVANAADNLQRISKRIFFRGWYFINDLESALIVLVVLAMLAWGYLFQFTTHVPVFETEHLPALQEEVKIDDIFPSGVPALESILDEAEAQGINQSPTGERDRNVSASDIDLEVVVDALDKLGETLGSVAATEDIGNALKRGDLEVAAESFENLADQVGAIPEETQKKLSNTLNNAASEIEKAGAEQLGESLDSAADALKAEEQDPHNTADELDEVASDLRDLNEHISKEGRGNQNPDADSSESDQNGNQASDAPGSGAGTGAGSRERSNPEPTSSLEAEGTILNLDSEDDISGLLRPGTTSYQNNNSVVGGAYDFSALGDEKIISEALTPYYYSWRWIDVVSEYFTPK